MNRTRLTIIRLNPEACSARRGISRVVNQTRTRLQSNINARQVRVYANGGHAYTDAPRAPIPLPLAAPRRRRNRGNAARARVVSR